MFGWTVEALSSDRSNKNFLQTVFWGVFMHTYVRIILLTLVIWGRGI